MSLPEQQPRRANGDIAQTQSFELRMRGETLSAPDLESQTEDKDVPRGWFGLCRQQRLDTRRMVVPSFMEARAHCLIDLDIRIASLYAAVQRAYEAGEEATELSEKLRETIARYDEMVLRTNQVSALGQPHSRVLRNILHTAKIMLKDVESSFLDEPHQDWVSVVTQDKLDNFTNLILNTDIGRKAAWPFLEKTERIGQSTQFHYYEGLMKFVLFTVFSIILGVFTCAPAGIQSLNVESVVGEVAVYVSFVIVFGWLCLGLFQGFEKSLLSSLAFAALMATLLRGNN